MSIEALIVGKGTTCDVYTISTVQDAYGGATETETLRLNDEPVFVDELSGNERLLSGREGVESTHRFFFRAGTVIYETDHIKIGSETYDVDWVENPHRFGHHVEVLLTLRQ